MLLASTGFYFLCKMRKKKVGGHDNLSAPVADALRSILTDTDPGHFHSDSALGQYTLQLITGR